MAKDPRLKNAGIEVKIGDKSGQLTAVRFETVGKNKTVVAKCDCGVEKVFWKKSAFSDKAHAAALSPKMALQENKEEAGT